MKDRWKRLLAALDARNTRERGLLLAAGLAIILLLGDTLFVEPARRAHRADSARLAEQRSRLIAMEARQAELLAEIGRDPDEAVRARLQRLQEEADRTEDRLAATVERFIPANRMHDVLRALLTQTGGLRLNQLRSLPSQALDAGTPTPAAPPHRNLAAETVATTAAAVSELAGNTEPAGPGAGEADEALPDRVWKRRVELQLGGDYNALLAYLQALESLPWVIDWNLLVVDQVRYPEARFILQLHTLSLDEEWIGV